MQLVSILSLATVAAAAVFHRPITTSYPPPSQDDFYNQPKKLDQFKPGGTIRSRKVSSYIGGLAVDTFQTFYRTNNALNKPIGTVATIWKPSRPIDPPKIFAFQHAEDSLNLECSISWGHVNRSSPMSAYYEQPGWVIPWALSQGYYVVLPDHEGPESAWLVGRTAGQATLDGLRSAIDFLHLQGASTALFGYSGGAHASAWAASLAESYAPELDIASAAFGGTPVDLHTCYDTLNGTPEAILAGAGLAGVANGYPEVAKAVQNILTDKGKQVYAKLVQPDQCSFAAGVLQQYINLNFTTLFTKSQFDDPTINKTLNENSLLADVSPLTVPVPKMPRFQWHGLNDHTTPYASEQSYVKQQCAKGANIRFVSLPGLTHVAAFERGVTGALQFISQVFEGTLPDAECGSNVTIPSFGTPASINLIGYENDLYLSVLFQSILASGQ